MSETGPADWWPLAAGAAALLLLALAAAGGWAGRLLGLLLQRRPRTCPRCGETGLEVVYADARSGSPGDPIGHAYLTCRRCDARFRRDLRRSWRHLEAVSEEAWRAVEAERRRGL